MTHKFIENVTFWDLPNFI